MVAKTPPLGREKRLAAATALNPALIRETLKKVDRCVARLQEMQHTVSGGRKTAAAGLRLNTGSSIQKSPVGKFPAKATGEWHRMSLPAMLLGETLLEIQQASRFAKRVTAVTATADPKTPPLSRRPRPATQLETPELRSRRAREKQYVRQSCRTENGSPTSLPRVRARIAFRPIPPKEGGPREPYRHVMAVHRVQQKEGSPWSLKKKKGAVLFPNGAFGNSSSTLPVHRPTVKAMMVPGIKRKSPPHKFLVKSPAGTSKFQVRFVTVGL